MRRTRFIAALLACGCLGAHASAQLLRTDDEIPEQQGVGIADRAGEALPLDAQFVSAQGKPVTLGDYFDGELPVLLVPVYFDCPVLCPMTRQNVLFALNQMDWVAGEDYRVVCYSFDHSEGYRTARATQEATLAGYTKEWSDAERTWAFLTTPEAATAKEVSAALGFYYRYVPEAGEYSHSAGVFICTPDGVVHNSIEGLDFSGEELQSALKAARDGDDRTIIEGIYLWCFPYDPETGKNTPKAWRVMTVGATGGALLLFSTIGVMIWRTGSAAERDRASAIEARSGGNAAGRSEGDTR